MVKPINRSAPIQATSSAAIIRRHHLTSLRLLFAVLVAGLLSVSTVSTDIPVVVEDEQSAVEQETVLKDYMICRQCGYDISLSNFLLNIDSPQALQTWNDTFYRSPGIHVQELTNPQGSRFRVVCVRKALCSRVDSWNQAHTWYPGFAWKVCLCPKCSSHIGWMFEPFETAIASQTFPTDRGFYALTVNNVLSESYINSLLATDWNN